MNKQSLQKLRDKVATGTDVVDTEIVNAFGSYVPLESDSWNVRRACDGSLDAAVAFLEAVLPDWEYSIHTQKSKPAEVWITNSKDTTEFSEGFDLIPARALLLATLDALIEGAE